MNPNDLNSVVAWKQGGHLFGIDIRDCSDVLLNVDCARVPHAADFIVGIVNLRGDVVTVLNLANLLGYASEGSEVSRALVRLKTGGRRTAIIADEVLDIVSLSADRTAGLPAHMTDRERRFVSRVAGLGDELIYIVDEKEILKAGSTQ